ncbi:MAG: DUF5813 family protein [Salinirussus sp.]
MTDDVPSAVAEVLRNHTAIAENDGQFRVNSTVFEATVDAEEVETGHRWVVTVTVPGISAATSDPVGEAVADGWFETFERRLADAPKATRAALDLDDLAVERAGLDVIVTFAFVWDNPHRAVDIAKTLVEYVEGTYVEGTIPGYTYQSPVSDLLSAADSGGDAERGGTPL